jgi:hypothetical protein
LFFLREYLNKIAEEMNDELLEKGVVLVSDLSNQFSLPVEFMQQVCN